MSLRTVILGDGQMALVMADALVESGAAVTIWSPFETDAAALAATRRSPRLPEFVLPADVQVTADEARIAQGQVLISAIPTQYLRSVWRRIAAHVPATASIVSVTKGIENTTLLRPTQVIEDVLMSLALQSKIQNSKSRISLCALSGPTIAAELARRLPASLVAASSDASCALSVQKLFSVPWLRVYRSDDIVGVESAAAAKNVIALAAGMIDGLEAGANAKSALLARGLAEIARLGIALGARLDTFFGIAGVGDLATTCFSREGRNRSCGERLGRGETLDSILASSSSIIEGVPTTRSVVELARIHDVDMPITQAVHSILFEGLTPRQAIRDLMSREVSVEQVG